MSRPTGSTVWPVVHDERRAVLHDLEGLLADRWATPSLCPGWDVHDVLAHLVDAAKTTRRGFLLRLVAARFDFDRDNDRGVARERAADPMGTLAALRAVLTLTSTPPAPLATRLVEAFVHGEDIRRPLAIHRDYPASHVVTALAHQVRTRVGMGGGRERVEGLRLVTTDATFAQGEGPEVTGRAIALLLTVSGRPVASGEVGGDGAGTLLERIAT